MHEYYPNSVARPLPKDFELSKPPGPFLDKFGGTRNFGFPENSPLIVTTYFYWYDRETGLHIRNPDGHDLLQNHPPDHWSFSYHDVDFHRQQFEDMIHAGIDVALLNWWGSPYTNDSFEWTYKGIPYLIAAREQLLKEGKNPPAFGLFYDTCTLGNWANSKGYHIDLREIEGKKWFYGSIRDFFSYVPDRHRAKIDGRLIVFLYSFTFAVSLDEGTIAYARKMFRKEYGYEVFFVKMRDNFIWEQKKDPPVTAQAQQMQQGRQDIKIIADILATDEALGLSGRSRLKFAKRMAKKLKGKYFNDPKLFPLGDPILLSLSKLLRLYSASQERRWQNLYAFLRTKTAFRHLLKQWYRDFVRTDKGVDQLPEYNAIEKLYLNADENTHVYLNAFKCFLSSDAVYKACGNADEIFVMTLCQKILGRLIKDHELIDWQKRLKQQSRWNFIGDFFAMAETQNAMVAWWYHFFLGREFCGPCDSEYHWGGAIQPFLYDTITLGPGYDDSAVPGRDIQKTDRENGEYYKRVWNYVLKMQPRPWIVNIETWNEFHEATEICESKEYGRTYLDLTHQFSKLFKDRS